VNIPICISEDILKIGYIFLPSIKSNLYSYLTYYKHKKNIKYDVSSTLINNLTSANINFNGNSWNINFESNDDSQLVLMINNYILYVFCYRWFLYYNLIRNNSQNYTKLYLPIYKQLHKYWTFFLCSLWNTDIEHKQNNICMEISKYSLIRLEL
jgi:hypothetical protein